MEEIDIISLQAFLTLLDNPYDPPIIKLIVLLFFKAILLSLSAKELESICLPSRNIPMVKDEGAIHVKIFSPSQITADFISES